MEYFDLRDGFGWPASLHDIVNTNLMPLVLVLQIGRASCRERV